jgi:hypothetical protein
LLSEFVLETDRQAQQAINLISERTMLANKREQTIAVGGGILADPDGSE